VNGLLNALTVLDGVLRVALLAGAVLVTAAAGLSYAVRTRRVSAFGGLARFVRRSVDPAFAPMERRVVRAGGRPANAPWWSVAALVVAGILLISLLGFLRGQIVSATSLVAAGPRGLYVLLVSWTIGVLRLALLVRVISSWFQLSPWSPWVRWSFTLTEWLLGPLRRVIPSLGPMDISPIVAYFALALLEWVLLGLVR
jgi:YggT family protein